jgi:hypothetical protein
MVKARGTMGWVKMAEKGKATAVTMAGVALYALKKRLPPLAQMSQPFPAKFERLKMGLKFVVEGRSMKRTANAVKRAEPAGPPGFAVS